MRNKKKLKTGLLTAALAGMLSLAGLAGATENGVEKLTQLLGGADTLSARFTQLTLDATGAHIQESTGQMKLKRPGKFIWHTDPPLQQELVSDGSTIWLYDPDLMQVTIQQLDDRMTHTPALLLSGDVEQIEESFEVEYRENAGAVDFILSPKAPDTLFDRLRLSFSEGVINSMQLEDAVGQKSSLYFFDLELNHAMDDASFEFDIPDGVDVIEE